MSRAGCALPVILVVIGLVVAYRSPALGIAIAVGGVLLSTRAIKRSAAKEHLQAEAERQRLEAVAPASGAAWRPLLEAERIPAAVINGIAPLLRPAVRMTARHADTLPAGASRVGGVPDLPPGLEWPSHRGKPLTFLAQINLEEVKRVNPSGPLPLDGHLFFFYDSNEQPWGFDPAHASGSRVLYAPAQRLAAATPPEGLHETFPACRLEMVAYDDVPDLEHDDPLAKPLDEAAFERYLAIRDYLATGPAGSAHKLLGYADPVQGEMELECEMVSAGLNVGEGYPDTPRKDELRAAARSWRLLLQLESDNESGMMWGDAGRLYFWIRLEDLEARHFDRARTILQCH